MLAEDVSKRIESNQMGFESSLHPATYLNNQRWEDEIQSQVNFGNQYQQNAPQSRVNQMPTEYSMKNVPKSMGGEA